MRKFQFSLHAALGMRERSVEAAENALRGVREEWNTNQRKQQELTDEVRRAEFEVRTGPVNPADYLALDRYRATAQRRRLQMTTAASEIARRLAERRAAWQEAEQGRTLLVRLKEKALSRWQLEYDKEQQQLAEEAYLSRWNAQQGHYSSPGTPPRVNAASALRPSRNTINAMSRRCIFSQRPADGVTGFPWPAK